MNIKSILIANRGEIAIRIAKTAKRMGIKTYMFLSHHEPNALHLDYADDVVDVSDLTHLNIYTSIDEVLKIALSLKVDAIHPGYGFLAENANFAKACESNGIIFIGPSSESIHQMGDKGQAREFAIRYGIPVLPGSDGVIHSLEVAEASALNIGYPVILKALAGGGGKGMRVVRDAESLPIMYKLATNEASALFNNKAMLMEKFIENPRHIEFQVLADKHGKVLHLHERECSIQRKHQKLLEEAPSSALDDNLRARMATDAMKLCRETKYHSAGTVEFLLDNEGNYYFMEMNTRVQVEHPVTEAITGIDIIEQQIRIAEGKPLSINQDDVEPQGWAMEFRVNAEDVQNGFSPSWGLIEDMNIPDDSFLRCDKGYSKGKVVGGAFDSLVAKLIIWGRDRTECIANAVRILKETSIKGVKTTLPFFRQVLENESFKKGSYTTSFLEDDLDRYFYQKEGEVFAAAVFALQAYRRERKDINHESLSPKDVPVWVLSKRMKG